MMQQFIAVHYSLIRCLSKEVDKTMSDLRDPGLASPLEVLLDCHL